MHTFIFDNEYKARFYYAFSKFFYIIVSSLVSTEASNAV